MPITIGPKKPMLTAVSNQGFKGKKKCKSEDKHKQYMEKICAEQDEQYNANEAELKNLSPNLDIFTFGDEVLGIEEKKEIIKFAKMCEGLLISSDNKAKIVKTVQYVSRLGEWDKFPLIRAKVEFSRPSKSNITHKGIDPKYYGLVMKVLGSETAGTDARVVKTTSF